MLLVTQDTRFFSRANINSALWALVVGIVGFAAGSVWSLYKGKEKVIIATTDDGAKPIVVRVEKTADDPAVLTIARIDVLVDEVRRLREQTGAGGNQTAASSRSSRPTVLSPAPKTEGSGSEPSPAGTTPSDVTSYAMNRPFLPELKLPEAVRGYTRGTLTGFGRAACPAGDLSAGDTVAIRLSLNAGVRTEKLTPVFLSLSRRVAERRIEQVFKQQFHLQTGVNQFPVPLDVPPGIYEFEVGFYSRNELNSTYPRLYGLACTIAVR